MMGRQCWCSLAGRWPALRAGSGARNLIHGDPRAGGPASAQHSPDFLTVKGPLDPARWSRSLCPFNFGSKVRNAGHKINVSKGWPSWRQPITH